MLDWPVQSSRADASKHGHQVRIWQAWWRFYDELLSAQIHGLSLQVRVRCEGRYHRVGPANYRDDVHARVARRNHFFWPAVEG